MTEFFPDPPPPVHKTFSSLRLWTHGLSLLFFLAVLIPALGLAALFASGPLIQEKTIVVARGASAADIGAQLAQGNAVYLPFIFRIAARAVGSLKAGEYALPARASAFDIAKIMNLGLSIARLFTVAEGLTSAEIVGLLNNDSVLTGTINGLPAEGSLLPETYRYSYGDSRAGLIARMQKAMQEKTNELWGARENGLPLKSVDEAVVLASIIEKETGKAEERPRIAGVFYNRLRQNMRLQSDPTVIYALTGGKKELDRALTHEDLLFPSPINTYARDGLPPKPICNPGHAALEAALHPEHNDFLYFVADGSGGHAFAANLAAHNKNINLWHRAMENTAIRP
jgi:UPF0755 protein